MEATHTVKDVKLPLRSSSDLRQKPSVVFNNRGIHKTFSSRRLSSANRGETSSGSDGAATSKGAVLFLGSDSDDDSSRHRIGGGGVGHGVKASVPFTWESQPGTPKVNHNHNDHRIIPPLTPPPSYFYCSTPARKPKPHIRKLPKSSSTTLLHSIFPRLGPRKPPSPPSPTTSSSSSSSTSSRTSRSSPSHWPSSAGSVPASPIMQPLHKNCSINARFKASNSSRLSLDSRENIFELNDDADDCEPDVSATPYFRLGRGANNPGSQGCYLAVVKLLRGKFL